MAIAEPTRLAPSKDAGDDRLLAHLGYREELRRTMGGFSSFALAFAIISVTTTYFTLLATPFRTVGGVAIWLWIPALGGILLAALIYGHLAARLPITGYSYHWCTRLVNVDYGWFTGYNAMLVQWTGTGTIAVALASAFAPDFWTNPTHADIILLSVIVVVVAVALNIVSIRLVSRVNNLGTGTELVGTLGVILLLGVGLAFFHHPEGPGVLFHVGSTTDSKVTLTAWGGALLVPVFTMGGWEGCADLAEETHDPRRVAPRSMVRGLLISGVVGFLVYAVYGAAAPKLGFDHAFNSTSTNAAVGIFQLHFGGAQYVLQAVAFVSIFSCVLANVTVATRTGYSLSRDNMLPGSSLLRRVPARTRTPVFSAIAVGVVAIGITLLSSGIISRIASFSSVMLYVTYGATVLGALIGSYRGTIPEGEPGYFDLGRWVRPVAYVFLVWAVVVIVAVVAPGPVVGLYVAGFEVVGLLWYLAALRSRLRRGTAGPAGITRPAEV